MKIYESQMAVNCRRVSIFLAEKGVPDVEFEQLDLVKGENLSKEFAAKNRFRRVPVLELDDGAVLAESVAICRYFEETVPEPPLFGTTAFEKAEVEMWSRRMEFSLLFSTAFYFRHTTGFFKDREKVLPEWGEMNEPAIAASYKLLDRHLEGRNFMVGDSLTIADITAWCSAEFAGGVGKRAPENCPNVTRWFKSLKARPGFAR